MNKARVLTLDEVLASGNKLMWLEYKSANTPEHYELYPDSPLENKGFENIRVCFHSGRIQAKGLYGIQWRCWTEKPSLDDATNWD